MTYDFSQHPKLQALLRKLSAFNALEPMEIVELLDGLADIFTELDRLQEVELAYTNFMRGP